MTINNIPRLSLMIFDLNWNRNLNVSSNVNHKSIIYIKLESEFYQTDHMNHWLESKIKLDKKKRFNLIFVSSLGNLIGLVANFYKQKTKDSKQIAKWQDSAFEFVVENFIEKDKNR